MKEHEKAASSTTVPEKDAELQKAVLNDMVQVGKEQSLMPYE
jgi:hypothetical protein